MSSFIIPVFVICLFHVCFCSIPFKYEDRSGSPHKIVHVISAHISPDPVVVPGDLVGDIQLSVPRVVSGRYKLKLNIEKKVLFWIHVPCISGVGSCEYEFCDLLSTSFVKNNRTECPPEMTAQNLPCTCPFQPGTYTLKPTHFTIPKLSSLWSWLASGDYHVDAKLIDESTGEEVVYYHVEISAEKPPSTCSGFLCSIFG